MDQGEIIRAAPEITKIVAPFAAAIPFTGIVKRMLGPAADELAEMWKDQIRLYRYGRQIRCIEKAKEMAQDAGFVPNPVPPKILFPLLEGASMEEDETLHNMWAALLANASSEMGKLVRPSFIKLLQDMAPDEAALLKNLSDRWVRIQNIPQHSYRVNKASPKFAHDEYEKVLKEREAFEEDRQALEREETEIIEEFRTKFPSVEGEEDWQRDMRFRSCLQTLEEAGLIIATSEGVIIRGTCRLTDRGTTFLMACSPPEPKVS